MTRQTLILNYSLVYLLLFVSGTWRYLMSPDKYLVIVFLVVLSVWLVFSDRRIVDRFLLYTAVFALLLVALYVYTGGGHSLSSVIASVMKIVLAYFVIYMVGDRFVETYVKLIVFLAAISIFGYLTDIFGLFEGVVRKLPRVGDMGYEGILYLFRCDWHMERNNSIFFEPGAYQAFLNSTLFILFFVKTGFDARRQWIYIVIVAAALITTFSTNGMLIFAVMLLLFFYRSKLLTPMGKIKLIAVVTAVVAILANQFYSTVVVKVEEYVSAGEYERDSSASTRSTHAKTDMKIFFEHVFGVGNMNYAKEFGAAGRIDLTDEKSNTSSNGVTKTLAVYGLPFSLFIFGSYFWAMRRMLNDRLLSTAAFAMFLMFLAGESYYIAAPISYAIIAGAFLYDPGLPRARHAAGRADGPARGRYTSQHGHGYRRGGE